jgi:hypothetical protein
MTTPALAHPRQLHGHHIAALTSLPSDLEIARTVMPRPVAEIAYELGFRGKKTELYGFAIGALFARLFLVSNSYLRFFKLSGDYAPKASGGDIARLRNAGLEVIRA